MTLPKEKISEYAERLHRMFNELPRYKKPFDNFDLLPRDGLCITFENGQKIFSNKFDRVVHIGFHYSNGNNRNRIGQFFLTTGRDATLKRHIGAALIKKTDSDNSFLKLWKKHPSKRDGKDDVYFKKESQYNEMVHEYIYNNMSFSAIPYSNSDKRERKVLKDKILYTLAMYNKNNNLDSWLGEYSDNSNVKNYGLWAEDYLKLGEFMTEADFVLLENLIQDK